MTTADELWALRYPDTHSLYVLERRPGGHRDDRQPRPVRSRRTPEGAGGELADLPSVVVASERLDDDPGWRELSSGELVHVGPDQRVGSRIALPDPPAHQLTEADLGPHDAASQNA